MSRWWAVAGLMLVTLMGCSEADPIEIDLTVTQVVVAPNARVLTVGDTMRLTAYPKTMDGTIVGGVAIGWQSENPEIATVSANGIFAVVEAKTSGTTRIRAIAEGKTGEVTVTVTDLSLPVAAIVVTPVDPAITVGGSLQLEAVLKAANGTVLGGRPVQWSSAIPSRATVTSIGNPALAVVTAQAAGDVLITATSEGVTGQTRVRVNPVQTPVGFIVITPTRLGSWIHQSMNYAPAARVLASNGLPLEGRTVTWSVSDTTVARMQPNGLLQTLRAGTTEVIATAEGVSGRATLVVFQYPLGTQMQFGLTYDWWDNQVRIMPNVGTAIYVDATGIAREVNLVPETGTFTMDKVAQGNRWQQELVLAGYAADAGGSMRRVVEQRVIDRGTYTYDPLSSAALVFTSETRPGYTFTGQAWNYEFHITQKIGTAQTMEYRYRLPTP